MAWNDFLKKRQVERVFIAKGQPSEESKNFITEQVAKGKIERQMKQLGIIKNAAEHPEDYKLLEDVYKKVPIVHGAINKTVDATIGPGFRVLSDNPKIEEVSKQILKDFNFDFLLRNVARDLLIYGTAFVEVTGKQAITALRTLTPKHMYVQRTET